MVSVKRYKYTALTIAVVGFATFYGVGLVVDPDSSSSDQIVGVALMVTGAAAAVGLWCLVTNRLTAGAAQTMIVIGLIAAGALSVSAMLADFGFFVWVFGPLLILALLAFWLGVVNRGLRTELAGAR